jgi:hypothetical protein
MSTLGIGGVARLVRYRIWRTKNGAVRLTGNPRHLSRTIPPSGGGMPRRRSRCVGRGVAGHHPGQATVRLACAFSWVSRAAPKTFPWGLAGHQGGGSYRAPPVPVVTVTRAVSTNSPVGTMIDFWHPTGTVGLRGESAGRWGYHRADGRRRPNSSRSPARRRRWS